MKKRIDPLTIAIVSIIISGAGSIYAYKYDSKTLFGATIATMIIAALYFVYLFKYGSAKIVENNHPYTWYKPENSQPPQYLAQGKTAARVDGISTRQYTNKVFKARNGQHFIIDANGQVKNVNAISRAMNAGWLPPDSLPDNWNPIYEKAARQPIKQ